MNSKSRQLWRWLLFLAPFYWTALQSRADIPSSEKLLPENTVFMVTTPEFGKLLDVFKASPQYQLWNDPAMKAFREKFLSKWNEEFRKPIERELDLNFDDYVSLQPGQVTFALVPNGSAERQDHPLAMLFLLDTRGQSNQLKSNLTGLRQKWLDAGKSIRTETFRGFEFSVVPVTSNDIPRTFQKFFPAAPQVQELGSEGEVKKVVHHELVIGQAESLLIVGSSVSVVEKIVARLTGASVPVLDGLAAYDSSHQALFREAPLYGWMNVKALIQTRALSLSEKKEPDAPDPFGNINLDKLIAATGFGTLKTVAFNYNTSSEGSLFELFLAAPEISRLGVFKVLSGEPKDSKPPPFVPADVLKFQRWRIDNQKAWGALMRMFGEIYPQWTGGLDLLLDAASNAAKEKDPGFDVRKYLIGNLGDDIVRYEKISHDGAARPLRSPPALFLVGSPRPEQLATALKSVLVFLNHGVPPIEREFLGHKIFSLPMPALGLPMAGLGGKPAPPRTLSCSTSGGYVAMSTDPSTLEEYMRSTESQARSLSEIPGLMEAAEKVTGSATALFGYENQLESERADYELLKKDGILATNNIITSLPIILGMPNPQMAIRQWSDFSLLPSFDRLAKYFHFTAYGVSSTADGITFKFFAPTPPQLR